MCAKFKIVFLEEIQIVNDTKHEAETYKERNNKKYTLNFQNVQLGSIGVLRNR